MKAKSTPEASLTWAGVTARRLAELTVDELTAAIEDRTGAWAVKRTMDSFQTKWPRWRQLTSTAAHRGVLCFGVNRVRNVTYTNPLRKLTAAHRRQLDEEIDIVGTVLESKPTLTLGTVTVGAHA